MDWLQQGFINMENAARGVEQSYRCARWVAIKNRVDAYDLPALERSGHLEDCGGALSRKSRKSLSLSVLMRSTSAARSSAQSRAFSGVAQKRTRRPRW